MFSSSFQLVACSCNLKIPSQPLFKTWIFCRNTPCTNADDCQRKVCSAEMPLQVMLDKVAIAHVCIRKLQFSSRWYLCSREGPYALTNVALETSPMLNFSSNIGPIDDGPSSSSQGRSLTQASSSCRGF